MVLANGGEQGGQVFPRVFADAQKQGQDSELPDAQCHKFDGKLRQIGCRQLQKGAAHQHGGVEHLCALGYGVNRLAPEWVARTVGKKNDGARRRLGLRFRRG